MKKSPKRIVKWRKLNKRDLCKLEFMMINFDLKWSTKFKNTVHSYSTHDFATLRPTLEWISCVKRQESLMCPAMHKGIMRARSC